VAVIAVLGRYGSAQPLAGRGSSSLRSYFPGKSPPLPPTCGGIDDPAWTSVMVAKVDSSPAATATNNTVQRRHGAHVVPQGKVGS
jgi:hypothetical protein